MTWPDWRGQAAAIVASGPSTKDAGVEQLILFHHRPERTDDEVDRCVAESRALVAARGGRLLVTAAAEGMTLSG